MDFLNQIIFSKEKYPKTGPHLVAAHIKGHGRRRILLSVCLFLLSLPSSTKLLLRYFFAHIRTNFSGIPMETEDQQLSRHLTSRLIELQNSQEAIFKLHGT